MLAVLGQRELVVVAIALVFQSFQVLAGVGDQAALKVQIADSLLQLLARRFQIRARTISLILYVPDLAFHSGDLAVHRAQLLLLFGSDALFRCLLLVPQRSRALLELLLSHPQLRCERRRARL